MADEPGGQLYSEKQAGAILKRAVERSAATGANGSSGISLGEMERIAAEIGIDPQHVRAAAADLSKQSTATGIIDLEQIVPTELSEEAWDSILSELRRVFGVAGTTSNVGRAREWDIPNVHASLVSRNGSTKVHLMDNHTSEITLAFAMWTFFSLFVTFMAVVIGAKKGGLDQALINALITSAVSATGFLGIRVSTQNWHRKQQRRMEGLLKRVSGLIHQNQPDTTELAPKVEAPELPVTKPVAPEVVAQQVILRNS